MRNNLFENAKKCLAGRLGTILADLLPGGKVLGNEYICASLTGGKGESCSTNLMSGVGSDFATGEKWGDIIGLAAKVWGIPQSKAARRLVQKYPNIKMDKPILPFHTQNANSSEKIGGDCNVVMPIPGSAPLPFTGKNKPAATWCYRNTRGKPLFYIARYDQSDGNKIIRPRSYVRDKHGKRTWQWMYPPAPRSLYGLDRLEANPDKQVLLVEGEKTADAAQKLFPDFVAMTWSGGANAVHKTDWSPLKGRSITIWPDNDVPGVKAADTIRTILPNLKVVTLSNKLPEKWDLADRIPKWFDYRQTLEGATPIPGPVIKDAAEWLRELPRPRNPILGGVFDISDKVFVIGGAKLRKSFFVLQLALSIASGRDFLGLSVSRPYRVSLAQFEIKSENYRRRLSRTVNAMRLKPSRFAGRLQILNCRGQGVTLDNIEQHIKTFRPELLILDPWYKLYGEGHDENSAGDTATMLAKVDRLAEQFGTAILIVHHDPKSGGAEQRHTVRGAGSGLVGRDYDAGLVLTPHANRTNATVLSFVLRNYAPLADTTICWRNSRFRNAPNIPPLPETSATRRAKARRGPSDKEIIEIVHGWFHDSPMGSKFLQEKIQSKFLIGEKRTGHIVSKMIQSKKYERRRNPKTKRFEVIPLTSAPSQRADIAE